MLQLLSPLFIEGPCLNQHVSLLRRRRVLQSAEQTFVRHEMMGTKIHREGPRINETQNVSKSCENQLRTFCLSIRKVAFCCCGHLGINNAKYFVNGLKLDLFWVAFTDTLV